MAEPGEAVSRELEVVDEGEPLLCARRLAQALPVLTWFLSAILKRRAAIVDATGPASPRQLMRDRRCEDDARGWESVSIRLRTLLFTRPGLFASPSLVPPSFVDRSSRDVAEAGTRTVALRSSSLSLLLLPHLARSVFNGSFALPRLLYSLDTRPSPLEHHAPPLAPPPLLHPSRPAPRPARPRPILNRQHPRLLQDLLRLHPHAVRRYQAGRGGIVACLVRGWGVHERLEELLGSDLLEPCGRRQGPAAMGRRLLVRRLDFVHVGPGSLVRRCQGRHGARNHRLAARHLDRRSLRVVDRHRRRSVRHRPPRLVLDLRRRQTRLHLALRLDWRRHTRHRRLPRGWAESLGPQEV
ncbi:RHTO0S11e00650g1_1 [Rhodotorula toruloides]|uniref:RHTO0S11e00650g1_1 n=1 Tax=Rhodotorula toruloides TaxID=5286 RepID=A0A061B7W4_RHOTO|nr:RHTO0S11e00650g1_1 [Rhodotorula toruloides]